MVKETRTNPTSGRDTQLAEKPIEKPLETQPKEVHVKTQTKEAVQRTKLSEGVSPIKTKSNLLNRCLT